MKKRLVIFDMDGLLLDSEKITLHCWDTTFRNNNMEVDQQFLSQLIGMGYPEAVVFFEKEFGDPEAFYRLVKQRDEVYKEYRERNNVEVKEGIFTLIHALKQHNVLIAVATSTKQEKATKLLKETKLFDLFDHHMFGDKVEKTKPDPEIFHRVIDYFSLKVEEALILEDSYYGVKAANNGNIDVVWIKDIVDIDKRGEVKYIDSFNSASEAYSTIISYIK